MKDEIEILLQTSAPRFQKQTGLKYQMHLLDTPREMWEKINSWRAGMTCADHRRLVFLLCVRLVCSSLYSCVFGWIDFLFLWLSSGSSCFTEMKETCRFSRYTLNQPWDTETAVYTEPQVSHVFFQDTEKFRNRIFCVIYPFLQNIAKYHKNITDITGIGTGKELYTKWNMWHFLAGIVGIAGIACFSNL